MSLRGRTAPVAIRTPVPSAPLPKGGWHGEAVTGGFLSPRTSCNPSVGRGSTPPQFSRRTPLQIPGKGCILSPSTSGRVGKCVSSAAGTGSCPADEMAVRRLQCIFRIPLPHSALPGGSVPPCSSVRLFRQNSGLPMNTEEVFLCPFFSPHFPPPTGAPPPRR